MKLVSTASILTAALMALLSFEGVANAEFVITVYQSGSNVVATGSGTINTAGLTVTSSGTAVGHVNPSNGTIYLGPATSTNDYQGTTVSGPSSFGSGTLANASSGSGPIVGVNPSNHRILLPQSYVSGAQLSDSSQWNSTTLSGLGLTVGIYTYTWGAGDNADSMVVDIEGPASLSISATHSTPIFQSGPGTITLTVTNGAGPTAGTATISDTIDPSFTINSASSGCSVSGQAVTCMLAAGTSAAASVFNVYVTALSTASASISNTATLSDADDTVATGSSTDTIAVGAQAPQVDASLTQLMLSGTTDNGTCAEGNRTLTATDVLQNISGSTLTDPYAVIDTLSQGNSLLSQSASSASVAAGTDVTFTFHIQLASCNTFQLIFDVLSN